MNAALASNTYQLQQQGPISTRLTSALFDYKIEFFCPLISFTAKAA